MSDEMSLRSRSAANRPRREEWQRYAAPGGDSNAAGNCRSYRHRTRMRKTLRNGDALRAD